MRKYAAVRCGYALQGFQFIYFVFAYIAYQILWNLECRDKAAATLGKKKLINNFAIKPVVSHISFKTDCEFWTV